ncbi:MAG: signal recognition particle receptor subunit alpha [Nanoarchaeota archaeon]|nr:signal recognition particle receptor subunit alpha [Nanoarchaeota archaeon]
MVLEKLGNVIKNVTDKIASAIFVDKKLVESLIKDLQRALIEADVNVKLVKEISDKIKKTALNEKIKNIEKKEQIIKNLHDTLLEILGGEKQELKIEKKKNQKIMLVGLYGSGKTTTTAKLANYYSKRGLKTAILGLDVHRPAANEQLEQLGKQNKLNVFINKKEKNPIKIYEEFKKKLSSYDLVIIDTAGRHSLDKSLEKEIKTLSSKIKSSHTILVMPADIGQSAKNQASEFQKACNITGVIITRMDSTAKAGGALTACNETKAKVFFITTGEKINDLETFNPSSFISRILGFGDLETLIEKVKSTVDDNKEKKLKKRLEEGKFTMDDMFEQIQSMKSVGSFSKLKNLIPGLGKAKIPENLLGTQEEKMKKWPYIIQSMTPEEKEVPELLSKQTSRIQRIAHGSGTTTTDVRSLLKQYKILKDFIHGGIDFDPSKGVGEMSQKQLQKLAKKFGKKIRL